MTSSGQAVIGVVGGSGGVGASTFAAALAVLAARPARPSLLVDLDAASGGIDILLGIEGQPGARWSGLQTAGGFLDPAVLLAGLPRAGPCAVLAADGPLPEAEAVEQVLECASSVTDVVVDLSRSDGPARASAVARCELVVLVARADVTGLVAAHAVARALPPVPIGLVVRPGHFAVHEAAALVNVPLLGVVPHAGSGVSELDATRLPRSLRRVAAGVLAGLARHGRPAAGLARLAPTATATA